MALEDTEKSVCLTERQINLIFSQIQYMRAKARWTSFDGSLADLDDLVTDIETRLLTECATMIDCVELENCLSQSNIINVLYVTQFMEQQNRIEQQYQVYESVWDGTPQSIDPNAPATLDFTQPAFEMATCVALGNIINDYIWRKLVLLDLARGLLGFGDLLISGVIGVGFALGLATEGTFVGDGRTVGSIALDVARNALRDENAVKDVICCAFSALENVAFNYGNFQTALDNCGFTVGSNQAIIRDFVSSEVFNVERNFMFFVDMFDAIEDDIISGTVYTCDCIGFGWNLSYGLNEGHPDPDRWTAKGEPIGIDHRVTWTSQQGFCGTIDAIGVARVGGGNLTQIGFITVVNCDGSSSNYQNVNQLIGAVCIKELTMTYREEFTMSMNSSVCTS